MTNSSKLYYELSRVCPGGHKHIHLMDGRAKGAEIYPPALCEAICRGIRKQIDHDALMQRMPNKMINSVSLVRPPPEIFSASWFSYTRDCVNNDEPDDQAWFTDDTSGAPLSPGLVREARSVEMKFFKRMRGV